jgi:hypothetical protein
MTWPPYHADFSNALLPHRIRTGVGSSMRASIKGAKKVECARILRKSRWIEKKPLM